MMDKPNTAATEPVRVLIVEDDMVDRMACRRAFRAAGAYALLEAETGQQGLELALSGQVDCVLLDYNLPDLTGLEFLASLAKLAGGEGAAPPVMMLTGADSATVAAEAMRRGARDYLVKDTDGRYLELLPAGIERMLREQRLRLDKQQAETRFRTLVEQIHAVSYVAGTGACGALQYVSPQIRMLLGYTPEEWLADSGLLRARMHPDDRDAAWAEVCACRSAARALRVEYRLLPRGGGELWVRDQADPVPGPNGPVLQGILIDISASKAAEQALRQSQDELRRLGAHQERIKEEERKRIAQEIHDELGGLLTGIRAYILVAQERAVAAGSTPEPLLADTADLVQSAIETVRRVITDLRPSVLDQLGVWAALEWYADQVALRAGLRCVCRIDAQAAALELDADRSTMLFRIVQEALTNVVRHAQATQATIDVACEPGALRLTVSDNGKGIAAEGLLSRESWGILGMHERSRSFGGQLAITGGPDGTVLMLRLPLEENQDDA
ncbi:hybrid sensor histidine kinase/response regulator [Pseudoduganella aquatica]|uniref:hybrid sensor histidine kinase/response regulator n=1 Tax=Pseudoduganella aquatica TaxID=2660641 RepID=UPI001E5ACB59|nr:response regulator [Pseudoduganella aquatica]